MKGLPMINRETEMTGRRQLFREEIRNAIREAIFSGELRPGERIVETFWAKQLGTSQGPVREAICDLEAQGLVETVPFKGTKVRKMTKKYIQDNYSVRICLEAKSIRDALSMLNDEQLQKLARDLAEILTKMYDCAARGDLQAFTDQDAAFHSAIIEATDNSVLLKLWEQCNIRNWFMFSVMTDTETLKQLHAGHQQILTAISRRDVAQATSLLEDHVTSLMVGYMQD